MAALLCCFPTSGASALTAAPPARSERRCDLPGLRCARFRLLLATCLLLPLVCVSRDSPACRTSERVRGMGGAERPPGSHLLFFAASGATR